MKLKQKIENSKNMRVVAGVGSLDGEDGGFHHHPHVDASGPLDLGKML